LFLIIYVFIIKLQKTPLKGSFSIKRPTGIEERPEQLRSPVIKGEGNTDSERYLAELAERSFLNLWSYPSPFRDQKQGGTGDGKEICDLLVICGRHIIIFSEKTIHWPGGTLATAWCRWVGRAVRDAAKQANGAVRWITKHPDRIFLDRECTSPFPIDLPASGDRIFHRVVVAKGASSLCKEHLPDSSGSLIIKPDIQASDHWSHTSDSFQPFAIGDLEPSGSFVHVFDEIALDIIMSELDTIRDFTDYLEKRSSFIRSGRLQEAHGEENLLAYYAIRTNEDGDHDFTTKTEEVPILIDRSHYKNFSEDPQYIAKKEADRISYLWDALINAFTVHMLDGTSITLHGHPDFELRKNELGVRYMALTNRFVRRSLGEAVADAFEKGKKTERFFRLMISPPDAKGSETAFFILTFKYLDWMEEKGGYEKYRHVRTSIAQVYAKGILERFSHLERVIGISREPPDQGRGISEDLVYAEQFEWSDEDRRAIREDCEALGLLSDNMQERAWKGREFPEVETVAFEDSPSMPHAKRQNRKQRRASGANARKRK